MGSIGFGFLDNAPGFVSGGHNNTTAPSSQPSPQSLTDTIPLLQNILACLQVIQNRLCPIQLYRTAIFNNDPTNKSISLNADQTFNMLFWSFTGGNIEVFYDIPSGNNYTNATPDFFITPGTQEIFLPEVANKTLITFVPSAACNGTIGIGKY